jgi:hypothetical protein
MLTVRSVITEKMTMVMAGSILKSMALAIVGAKIRQIQAKARFAEMARKRVKNSAMTAQRMARLDIVPDGVTR